MPVPDLAVGRLVKTPTEIVATVDHFLALQNGTLPAPSASLVTGYDFLADAADAVHDEFKTALPGRPTATTRLVDPRRHAVRPVLDGDAAPAALLGQPARPRLPGRALQRQRHPGGRLRPRRAVAADELGDRRSHAGSAHRHARAERGVPLRLQHRRPARGHRADRPLRLDPGHGAAERRADRRHRLPVRRHRLPRVQRAALPRHRAATARGPGRGDAPPVAVGAALSLAKQDYLASLATLEGIDQKAVLQATLYGLPMTGFDAPGRSPAARTGFARSRRLARRQRSRRDARPLDRRPARPHDADRRRR